jgi:hypothetical protein
MGPFAADEIASLRFAHTHLDLGALERVLSSRRAISHPASPFHAAAFETKVGVMAAVEVKCRSARNPSSSSSDLSSVDERLQAKMETVTGLAAFHASCKAEQAHSAERFKSLPKCEEDYACSDVHQLSRIIGNIYVGSYRVASNRSLLEAHNISHVLCLIDVDEPHPGAFEHRLYPTDDVTDFDITRHFDELFEFMDKAVNQGQGMLVHCGAGVSRAPTVVAGYLIRRLGIPAKDALALIRTQRKCSYPNDGFLRQLLNYSTAVLAQTPSPVLRSTRQH